MMAANCKKTKLSLLLGVLAIFVAVVWPHRPPERGLVVTLSHVTSNDHTVHMVRVMISNATDKPLVYHQGSEPLLNVARLTNSVWHHEPNAPFAGGPYRLNPHSTATNLLSIEGDVRAAKVGLTFTSLTWRGRLGWALETGPLEGITGPIARGLFKLDTSQTTKEEWSEPIYLEPEAK